MRNSVDFIPTEILQSTEALLQVLLELLAAESWACGAFDGGVPLCR